MGEQCIIEITGVRWDEGIAQSLFEGEREDVRVCVFCMQLISSKILGVCAEIRTWQIPIIADPNIKCH